MKQIYCKIFLSILLTALMLGTAKNPAQAGTDAEATVSGAQTQVCEDPDILPDQETLVEGYLEKALGDDNLFESSGDEIQESALQEATSVTSDSEGQDNGSVASGVTVTSSTPASESVAAYNNLSGQNAVLYEYLREGIKKVAAGTTTVAKFKIPITALLGSATVTEKKLGLTIYNEKTKAYGNMEKIQNKVFNTLLGFDSDKVNYALQCDCPYELYWYDKTVGFLFVKPGFTLYSTNGGVLKFTSSYVTVYMCVAKEFRSTTSDTVRVNGSKVYHLQTAADMTTAPKASAKAAKKLVSECAGLSDAQKLLAYKNYICNAVSYDSDAIGGDYGSSWQLLNVFDGDSSTNVVCEGYSKAFQYLCDLTEWNNDSICCYSITGSISNSTDTGNSSLHMWNIVHMPNGVNYMADITNSDAGTAGQDGCLFMAGSESADAGATWVQYEYSDDYYLTYVYTEEALGLFTKAQRTMSDKDYPCMEGHTAVIDNFVWATPAQNGKTAGKHCSACGEILKAQKTIYKPASISCSSLVYNGKKQTPTVTLKNSKGSTINSKYYKVTFQKSVKAGIYKLTITFYGNGDSQDSENFGLYRYAGCMTGTYKIKPKSTYISSYYSYAGKLSIYWKSQRTQTNGYQLQYATNSGFTKGVHTLTISSNKTTHKYITSLKRKTTYYVRIRTYKTVSGKKLVSSWSGKKKIKTK